jgi:hypothetical protein
MQRKLPPFDELMDLARNRPEEFERLRMALCEAAINQASEKIRPRLRGLQFRIDMERRRCHNPLASCIKISAMMHESLVRLSRLLNGEQEYLTNPLKGTKRPSSAFVIPLHGRAFKHQGS